MVNNHNFWRLKMTHIKTILAKVIENTTKAKFYHHNRDIFIKYSSVIFSLIYENTFGNPFVIKDII